MGTFVDAARAVLSARKQPLSPTEIWSAIERDQIAVNTDGAKTPQRTLYTAILRAALPVTTSRASEQKLFYREGARFGLLEWLPEEQRSALAKQVAQASAEADAVISKVLEASPDERVVARRTSEAQARKLLDEKVGRLGADDIREFFRLLNVDRVGDKTTAVRFGMAFVGHWVAQAVEALAQTNRWMEQLWKAPAGTEPSILSGLRDRDEIPGNARSAPTALLYLKAPERYIVLTSRLGKGFVALTGQPRPRLSRMDSYVEYCRAIQELCAANGVPIECHDLLLASAASEAPEEEDEPQASTLFSGFSRDTFAFLAQLVRNNNEDWFDENKSRFRDHVDRPLRDLVTDIGEGFIARVNPELEVEAKSRKTLGAIRKNIWGKQSTDCYQDHYWASFYRSDRTKQTDAQLYLYLYGGGFNYGFSFGADASDVRRRFLEALMKHEKTVAPIVADIIKAGFAFERSGDRTGEYHLVRVTDVASLVAAFDSGDMCVHFRRGADDARLLSPELRDDVERAFRALYPLYLFAISDAPAEALEKYRQFYGGRHELRPGPDVGGETAMPAYSLDDLRAETLLDDDAIEEIQRLLHDKRQLIFYGPPGTGKTYVAERLARYLAGSTGDAKTVQFHPAYGYEEFVEGIRPSIDPATGRLEYRVEPGIFRRFCEDARANPTSKYVLVIDEINRGNLPRIFGELMYMLEKRESKVDLPYSKKPFSVPRNVLVIGTMNTADRSIAMVDTALRRRFHFRYFPPAPELLRAWLHLRRPACLWVADLLEALNNELVHVERFAVDHVFGHSHFLHEHLDVDMVELIWDHTIFPTLEDHFYAQPEKLERFRFGKFVRKYIPDEDASNGDGPADA
jgi:5-methylcytosine-specific restriction enzyme B